MPINHMVIVREKIAKSGPISWKELFRVLKQARDLDTTAPKGKLDRIVSASRPIARRWSG